MPKARTAASAAEKPKSATDAARDAADAMFRAAWECCHQHDRVARIVVKSDVDEEVRVAQAMCQQCDDALRALSTSYEQTAANIRPSGDDAEWWHGANALWMASRDYLRRNSCCNAATKELKGRDRACLGSLHKEYELEGSALLALRQAAIAYRQKRPAAA